MKVDKAEYVHAIDLSSNDIIVKLMLRQFESSTKIVCETMDAPVTMLNGRDISARSTKSELDVDILDFMFPTKLKENTYEVVDKTPDIINEAFSVFFDYIKENKFSLLVFYKMSIMYTPNGVSAIYRFYAE